MGFTIIQCTENGFFTYSSVHFMGIISGWVRTQGTRELGTRRELDGCCGECGGYVAEYNKQRRFITLLIQEKDGKQCEEGQGCVVLFAYGGMILQR